MAHKVDLLKVNLSDRVRTRVRFRILASELIKGTVCKCSKKFHLKMKEDIICHM